MRSDTFWGFSFYFDYQKFIYSMTKTLFVSNGYHAMLRKLAAGLLMLSLNLTGGVGALF